jgi:hypothetical protein
VGSDWDLSLGRGVLEKKEKRAFLIATMKGRCDVSVRGVFDEGEVGVRKRCGRCKRREDVVFRAKIPSRTPCSGISRL